MSVMMDWALYYASLGWAVFPLVPGTKSPFKGSKGSAEATADAAQIITWWTENPDANIGCRPSSANLYVYDVDPRNGGLADHARLEREHGPISSPLRVNSPSGGWHEYFCVAPGARTVGKPAPGIDGKFNGYVVLPPSLHPNGGRYEWAGQPGAEPAAIPAFLLAPERVQRERTAVPSSLADVDKIRQALDHLDPDDYHCWVQTIASLKHWEETGGEDLIGVGYELGREWSERSGKHDDSAYEGKWESWDSWKPNARTMGSLMHDAGMTGQAQMVDAAAAFASELVQAAETGKAPDWWTAVPVPRFKGTLDAVEVLSELSAGDRFGFATHAAAGRWDRCVPAVVWSVGGSCEHALEVLKAGGCEDSPWVRGLIAADASRRTTWKTIYQFTDEQRAVAAQGLNAELRVDQTAAAARYCLSVLPAMPGLLQRSHRLCRVMQDGRILEHDKDSLAQLLETYLQLQKGSKGVPCDCPEVLSRRVLNNGEYHGVPEIRAAIRLPVVRSDGTVVTRQGIDAATGLYVVNAPARMPRPLSAPERQAVIDRVWGLFERFPFATAADRSAYWAAVITSACRAAIDTAPAFLISASAPGTGKTKLAECLMLLADATKEASVLPSDEAEQGKALLAILREGPRGVLFDNVRGSIKPTSSFCVASTSAEFAGRELGRNQMLKVSNRALWALTGNNVELHGDVVRRVLRINLESPENPHLQRHPFDPVEQLERIAGEVRYDLLDLFQSWVLEGRPGADTVSGFASFEQWNRSVRALCLWLGLGDPLDVVKAVSEEDPHTERLSLLMDAWGAAFGQEPVRLAEAQVSPFSGDVAALWQEAMQEVCARDGKQDPARLRYYLRDMKGRILKGRRFVRMIGTDSRPRWKLEKI
ncbi:hypothetical protein D3C78_297950 [compost metagenome]